MFAKSDVEFYKCVDTLVGYNFQKEKSLPASFKLQEILWLMLTFWKLDPV